MSDAGWFERVSQGTAGRPAILPPDLARAAGETRRFRHVAMRGCGSFDVELSRPSVKAAGVVAQGIRAAIAALKATVDPPLSGLRQI